MNIFFLNRDPLLAASHHCDKHVLKMIVESAQLLSTAHRVLDGYAAAQRIPLLLKSTHANHPCAVWVRQAFNHYTYVLLLLDGLIREYHSRYRPQVSHKYWGENGLARALQAHPEGIPQQAWVDPPQCMPDAYKRPDTVEAYRAYYMGEKARFATWRSPARPPAWWSV